MESVVAYVGLGANLGDRLATLRGAIAGLAGLGTVERTSSTYETVPVGYQDQPLFLNAVVALRTALSPEALLRELQGIEHAFGRVRSFPNAPRTLDLDLLLYGEQVVDIPGLTVPHPRMHERSFVLVPLAEIAPKVVHPGLGQSAAEILAGLTDVDRQGVRRVASLDGKA